MERLTTSPRRSTFFTRLIRSGFHASYQQSVEYTTYFLYYIKETSISYPSSSAQILGLPTPSWQSPAAARQSPLQLMTTAKRTLENHHQETRQALDRAVRSPLRAMCT